MNISEDQYILINNIDDCEKYGKIIAFGKSFILKFYTSYLKFHFFTILKVYNPNILIIDLNKESIPYDLKYESGIIFDNVKNVIFKEISKNITYIY